MIIDWEARKAKAKKVFVPTVYKPRSVRLNHKQNPFLTEKAQRGCRVFYDYERVALWEQRLGQHKALKQMQIKRVNQILDTRLARVRNQGDESDR